ncbi:hypothetical protein D0860_04902 [Hortaea werneckii]|uniref:Myb-like domain-containing protein n=1 Tax=Hortaea werneckii TaxID=91943 RepID=A0A3M7I0M6_HORWE|nr:hypothetical protein D0860_04902 [Hortaea werneckii]RMZ19063.1 hypothetical protein D0859_16946 [Hortaea werneckii]
MSNTSQNQQRSLKPTATTPGTYSASPSQLTLPSDTSSIGGFYNPYAQQNYGHAPSPHQATGFGFPQHPQYPPHLQTQGPSAPQAYQQQSPLSPQVTRKRRATDDISSEGLSGSASSNASAFPTHGLPTGGAPGDVEFGGPGPSQAQLPSPLAKKGRTNTPWTPAEEQRLKALREAGSSWSEIAKTFPARTEGSVKKHWYKVHEKASPLSNSFHLHAALLGRGQIVELLLIALHEKDMHYADFAEDESAALLQAIKDYENNKWKVIGQKVGKPAKVSADDIIPTHR